MMSIDPGTAQEKTGVARTNASHDGALLKQKAGWYSLQLNAGAEELIEQAWHAAVDLGTDFGESCAVFKKCKPELAMTLYFSPEAQLLARLFGATRCRMPSPTGAQLLLGDAGAFDLHFKDWVSTADRRRRLPIHNSQLS